MQKRFLWIYLLCLCFSLGCVKPFAPAVTTTNYNYLVVEGLINLTDSTIIKLSRTVTVTSKTSTKAELKATVTVESNTGATYALKEAGNGVYQTPPLNLSAANQYRLRIKTNTGATYLSDFTVPVPSPPIDTVIWKASDNLYIYLSTHDPKNATRYYRWDYSEGWIFHADYDSGFVSNGYTIIPRTKSVYFCYGSDTSNLISLGNSAALAQDVINQQLINTVASTSEKLYAEYSIQVKQYGLTKDAYDYWTLLKKNTENLGSIFDAQPSALIGNIHNVNNATEPVMGYISAGTFTTKRIFIHKAQLPGNWTALPAYPFGIGGCEILLPPNPPGDFINQHVNFLSSSFLGYPFQIIPIDAGTFALPLCVDCTLRGSTNKPSYWQ